MQTVKTFVPAALAILTLVTGCGGGGSDASEPLPLAVGNQWEYHFTDSRFSNGSRLYTVTGTQAVDGTTAYVMSSNWTPETVPYVDTGAAVLRYPGSEASDDEIARGPMTILKLPLTVGDQWTNVDEVEDSGEDIDGDGTNEVYTTVMTTRVTGIRSVDTPAGLFPRAYVVLSSSRGELKNPVTAEIYDWTDTQVGESYVPGIGVVSRSTNIVPWGGFRSYQADETLVNYRLR